MAEPEPKTMTEFQVDKYFDAIKQVGTANSAGVFGGLVALYYFKEKIGPVLTAIKYATGIYLAGLLFFVAAYCLFIVFVYKHKPKTQLGDGTKDLFEIRPPFESIRNITFTSLALWIAGTLAAAVALCLL